MLHNTQTGFKPVLLCCAITKMPKRKQVKTKVKRVVKRKRNSYTVEQKTEVVTYAKKRENIRAAEHFNIDLSIVGCWVKASSSWSDETNGKKKRLGSGRKPLFPEAESKLYSWIIEQRKQGLAVSYVILRNKMLEILKEPDMIGLYDNLTENFKTSHRWLIAFMRRYKLSLRQRTRISQKLPSKTQNLLDKFHQFVNRLRLEKSYELKNILNMDETPVWFDMAGNFTINPKGEKTVHIRATGNEKNRFTVVLQVILYFFYSIIF